MAGQTGAHSVQPVQASASTRGMAPPRARANRMAPVGQASRQTMQAMPGEGGNGAGRLLRRRGVSTEQRLRRRISGPVSEVTAAPLTPDLAAR